jgi:hypothetical protein
MIGQENWRGGLESIKCQFICGGLLGLFGDSLLGLFGHITGKDDRMGKAWKKCTDWKMRGGERNFYDHQSIDIHRFG